MCVGVGGGSPVRKLHQKDSVCMSLFQNHSPLEQLPISSLVFWHFGFFWIGEVSYEHILLACLFSN